MHRLLFPTCKDSLSCRGLSSSTMPLKGELQAIPKTGISPLQRALTASSITSPHKITLRAGITRVVTQAMGCMATKIRCKAGCHLPSLTTTEIRCLAMVCHHLHSMDRLASQDPDLLEVDPVLACTDKVQDRTLIHHTVPLHHTMIKIAGDSRLAQHH